VIKAREIQAQRFKDMPGVYSNAMMPSQVAKVICVINEPSKLLLKNAMSKLGLSARAFDRIIKVARTIADLEASEHIAIHHIAEAIQYRSLDRGNWNN
jgi:magnesium chelatase family protein